MMRKYLTIFNGGGYGGQDWPGQEAVDLGPAALVRRLAGLKIA